MSPSGSRTQIAGTLTAGRFFCRRASRRSADGTKTDGADVFLASRIEGMCVPGRGDEPDPIMAGRNLDKPREPEGAGGNRRPRRCERHRAGSAPGPPTPPPTHSNDGRICRQRSPEATNCPCLNVSCIYTAGGDAPDVGIWLSEEFSGPHLPGQALPRRVQVMIVLGFVFVMAGGVAL